MCQADLVPWQACRAGSSVNQGLQPFSLEPKSSKKFSTLHVDTRTEVEAETSLMLSSHRSQTKGRQVRSCWRIPVFEQYLTLAFQLEANHSVGVCQAGSGQWGLGDAMETFFHRTQPSPSPAAPSLPTMPSLFYWATTLWHYTGHFINSVGCSSHYSIRPPWLPLVLQQFIDHMWSRRPKPKSACLALKHQCQRPRQWTCLHCEVFPSCIFKTGQHFCYG